MSLVANLAEFLREYGVTVALGSTIVLASFAIGIALTRSPVQRQRLARLSLVAIVVYGAIAIVPMPRLSVGRPPDAAHDAAANSPGAQFGRMGVLSEEPTVAPTSAATREPVRIEPVVPMAAARPAQPGPVPPVPSPMDLATTLAWLLLLGGAIAALHLAVGWAKLTAILAASREAPANLRAAVALPPNVRLRIAERPVQPFCCGVVRRRIVLPPQLASASASAAFVLRHELAHLAAGDPKWRTLATALRPLLFWHPLFWWLQAQLRFSDEVLADDAAAGGAVADYVRSMMALASQSMPRVTGTSAAFVFYRRSELYRRLQMMLQREGAMSRFTPRWRRFAHSASTLMILAACGSLFGVERAVAQDPVREQRLLEQVEQMRATIAELRAEVAALRDPARAAARPGDTQVPPPETRQDPRPSSGVVQVGDEQLTYYRVRAGDTFEQIARDVYGSPRHYDRLRALNPELNPRRLRVGQLLRIGPDLAKDFGTATAVKPQTPANVAAPAMGSRSLQGVAEVVTRCIELRGQVRIAEIEVARAEQGAANGLASKYDLEIARIGLDTRRRQLEAIEGMLRRELESAQAELKRVELLRASGRVSDREVAPISRFVQVLQSIF